jgi:hypothetical protein
MNSTRFPDPYAGMTSDELDRHLASVLTNHRERQQAISIRFPAELLTAIRSLARESPTSRPVLARQTTDVRGHAALNGLTDHPLTPAASGPELPVFDGAKLLATTTR